MQRKRLYIISFGRFEKFFCESRDEAYKIWSIVSEIKIQGLQYHSHYPDKGDTQLFYYPSSMSVSLKSEMIDLHENEMKAQLSMDNYIKAEKMGIIKAKKKKKKT